MSIDQELNPNIYLDNASTTPLDPEVIERMDYAMKYIYGNPSSQHRQGREAKSAIENVRKTIADCMNTEPNRIIFTAGSTEGNNWIIIEAVRNLSVDHIITTQLEHPAILESVNFAKRQYKITVSYVNFDDKGHIDYHHLEQILKQNYSSRQFVCLMHANNEIGNLLNLNLVSTLCNEYKALFHSDTVQTMGHMKFNLDKLYINSCVCSPHKFHGPKGIGFVFVSDSMKINPLILGGGQEFNLRSGTENVIGILGMGKAIEIAYKNLEEDTEYITNLKRKTINKIKMNIPSIGFNGDSDNLSKSIHTILSLSITTEIPQDILALKFDMQGISISSGSACSSGVTKQSHVVNHLSTLGNNGNDKKTIRISFSKYNIKEEIDMFIKTLCKSIV